MTGKFVSTATRELTADELLMVAGAKPMEREASRYTAGSLGPIGWARSHESGCWAVRFGGERYGMLIGGCPGSPVDLDIYTPEGFLPV